MKKLILFLIGLFMVGMVFAQDMTLRESVDLMAQDVELPKQAKDLSIGIEVLDTGENFVVYIDENNDIKTLDNKEEVDVSIKGEMSDFELLGSGDKTEYLKTVLQKLDITANTIKGKLVLGILEKLLKIEFVKNRTFGFKFISMFASPISLFVK
jgi:hypothetical protein